MSIQRSPLCTGRITEIVGRLVPDSEVFSANGGDTRADADEEEDEDIVTIKNFFCLLIRITLNTAK